MQKLLVDTNVVIDLLAFREPFALAAQRLFSLADKGDLMLYVSALTWANAHFILTRKLDESTARTALRRFKAILNTVPLDEKIIDLALDSKFRDFEDAIQYYSALAIGAEVIITRNQSDFKHSGIAIMSAQEFLST